MSLKQRIITNIINTEAGYVNNPDDSGGPTRYGVTQDQARKFGYIGDMQDLPIRVAFEVYEDRFWVPVHGDNLARLSEWVAAEVVDTSVNAGPQMAGVFLQRSLNALNLKGEIYDDLKVDGIIGSVTLKALDKYLRAREGKTLVKMLNVLQGAYYVELVERREKDESFIYGWYRKRVKL